MNFTLHFIRPLIVAQFVLTGFNAAAQALSIPDPGLNAAIRQTLQKPSGQLSTQDLLSLTSLDASGRSVSSLEGLQAARNLIVLNLQSNRLATVSFPSELTKLSVLDLSFNPLTNCVFPLGLTNLTQLAIEETGLTSLSLRADMGRLNILNLFGNQLTNVALPTGLTQLDSLELGGNQLVSLTLPPDMTNLSSLFLDGNPLITLVLSEPLAGNLADSAFFPGVPNVSVFTYPLTPQLVAPRQPGDGSFQFALTAPPGVYVFLASTNLAAWNQLAVLTNQLGTVRFEDAAARLSPQKFYQVRSF
jgi:Leucine Rich Repeat (LRR) protein